MVNCLRVTRITNDTLHSSRPKETAQCQDRQIKLYLTNFYPLQLLPTRQLEDKTNKYQPQKYEISSRRQAYALYIQWHGPTLTNRMTWLRLFWNHILWQNVIFSDKSQWWNESMQVTRWMICWYKGAWKQ